MALRVFISHASQDSGFAERLAADLSRAEADVWLDATHIGGGNFVQRINEAINARDVLVLVLTPEALASRWVPDEMDAALVRYKQGFMQAPIVVLAKPVPLRDIPALWTTYNRIDASKNYDEALPLIARALGLTLPKAGLPSPAADARRQAPTTNPATSSGPTPEGNLIAQPAELVLDVASTGPKVTRRQVLIGAGVAVIAAAGIGGGTWFASAESSGAFRQKWRFQTAGQASAPIVANGLVYFGSTDSKVYALDARTGELRWTYQTGGNVTSSLAAANGLVYVGSGDQTVYALDSTSGTKRWSFRASAPMTSPVAVSGVVYVIADDNADDNVYALDAQKGSKLWSFMTDRAGNTAPAVANGSVYVSAGDDTLYAIDATSGLMQWKYQTGDSVIYGPAVANGLVYFGSFDLNVYALNAGNGAPVWNDLGTGDAYSTPAVANSMVYIGSSDQYLYALDAQTGNTRWKYQTFSGVSWPTVVNRTIYAGSDDMNVYAFDAITGAKLWTFHTGGNATTPAVANGIVYVASGDGYIYAING